FTRSAILLVSRCSGIDTTLSTFLQWLVVSYHGIQFRTSRKKGDTRHGTVARRGYDPPPSSNHQLRSVDPSIPTTIQSRMRPDPPTVTSDKLRELSVHRFVRTVLHFRKRYIRYRRIQN